LREAGRKRIEGWTRKKKSAGLGWGVGGGKSNSTKSEGGLSHSNRPQKNPENPAGGGTEKCPREKQKKKNSEERTGTVGVTQKAREAKVRKHKT